MNTFDPNMQISSIILVGLGGTGSQVARSVARIVYDMKEARMHTPKIAFIDPDIVEAKNVGRQLFVEGDIGQTKAHVLMRRFNMALGLDITAFETPLKVSEHVSQHGAIVIGAVDNHLARRELAKIGGCIWIDAGNHQSAGQVIIGNTRIRDFMLKNIDGEKGKYMYLPTPALLFPSLLEPEPPKPTVDLSCAELVAAREQDLLINDWMATVTSQYVYRLLHRQPINSFITYIDADGMNVRSLPINRDNLLPYLQLEGETLEIESPKTNASQGEQDQDDVEIDEDFDDDDLDEDEYIDEDDYVRHGA